MKVDFYELGTVDNQKLKFGVVAAYSKGKLVLVRHKDRNTWEMPGGHREDGEDINDAGRRELVEETGAKDFSIKPNCEYSVTRDGVSSYGRLFYSEISSFDELPHLEIAEVKLFTEVPKELTYPEIIPRLLHHTHLTIL
ncbi:NUDIX hydrolase [Alkaliphilus transvaalensis]|uniref:NUDIX hydrolase n=1 Tax=Alkaliphilus transvaalensis TaxID=114628 RepID=UPI00047E5579|nr:NUDIX domain-containing protein [Alkaliphilus transvaalensis]